MNIKSYINFIMKDKKAVSLLIMIVIISLIILYSININSKKTSKESVPEHIMGYKILINSIEVGIVKDKNVINTLLSEIEEEIEQEIGFDIHLDKESIRYTEIPTYPQNITEISSLKNKIKSNLNYSVSCYTINIEGDDIVHLKTKSDAQKVIDNIKSIYWPKKNKNGSIEIKNIDIAEKISINPTFEKPQNIMDIDNAVKYLLKGTLEDKIYVVKKGDNLWSIAKRHNMKVEDIIKANPEINPNLIHIDDKINLIVPKPYINVEVKYIHTYTQNIPYSIVVKNNPNLERTKHIVEKKGKYGKKEITAEIVERNGTTQNKQIVKEKIILEPETEIVVKGTKRLPIDELAVAFLPNGMGIVTSRFGMRWGRHHNGVDVAVPIGTPIYSYMDGTVEFAGWKNGYGKLVIVNHGNGYETYYGHCSKILVKSSDKVSKRQLIALSGNTGRSTGPHVHFEIHKDGKPIDPIKFLMNHK